MDTVAKLQTALGNLSLPIWISILSLALSALAFYFNSLRRSTDLRVRFIDLSSDDPRKSTRPKIATKLTFSNNGKGTVTVLTIELGFHSLHGGGDLPFPGSTTPMTCTVKGRAAAADAEGKKDVGPICTLENDCQATVSVEFDWPLPMQGWALGANPASPHHDEFSRLYNYRMSQPIQLRFAVIDRRAKLHKKEFVAIRFSNMGSEAFGLCYTGSDARRLI